MTAARRRLSLLDCVAIGINGIVGSGVYLLLSPLAKKAGVASITGIFACGVLSIFIALCFAELGGMFDRNGGSYVYANEAFGRPAGFAVGWMSMATGVLAFAAVACGFADALASFVPAISTVLFQVGGAVVTGKTFVSVALIVGLGVINYLDVKAGARTSDFLSFAKLAPLLLVAVVGLPALANVRWSGLVTLAPSVDAPTWGGSVANAAFLAVFMLSGFEYTAVPAGEAKEARRNIPIAIVGSLMGATLLYCVLQGVALGSVANLAASERPLLDVGHTLLGQFGETVLGLGALISMAGFCSGSALVGPRYFTALADDGFLPKRLASVGRRGTPGAAIVLSTSIAALLAVFLEYGSLVDVSNVALFGQFIPTTLAVMALRVQKPDAPRMYRLPGGFTIPLIAATGSVVLLWAARPAAAELWFALKIIAGGVVVWALTTFWRKNSELSNPKREGSTNA